MTWVLANWVNLVAIGSSSLVVAGLVVKLTPGDKDDKFVEKLRKLFKKVEDAAAKKSDSK